MVKTVIAAFALVLICSAAQATPSVGARRDGTMTQPHKYWLSDGLNRLVFWQPPTGSRKRPETKSD